MRDKAKRKHDTTSLFKLKLTLIAFIIGTVIATFFPMIWLAPPFFKLTPFVYIGLSLLWIPIVWRVLRHVTGDRVVRGLMIVCLVSSILMSFIFYDGIGFPNLHCHNPDTVQSNAYFCNTGDGWCPRTSFPTTRIGNVLIAQRNPWNSYACFAYMF